MSNKDENHAGLERRDFLRGAGALAAGGVGLLAAGARAAEVTASACKMPGCDYDVVVIGGGFAGAAAARDCRENGLKTLLLEARNRLGGRTFTSTFEGHEIELGGTWIHWTQPFVWAETERYGLEVIETPGAVPDRMLLHLDGKTRELGEEDLVAVMQAFQALTAEARDVLPRPFDIRFNWEKVLKAEKLSARDRMDQLDLSPVQSTLLEGLCASSAHNSAANWSYVDLLRWSALAGYNDFLLYMDSAARFKLKDGTISLLDAMLEDGKPEVRLSTPVRKVEDLGDKVRVTTARGDVVTAGAVICTAPMNVLPSIDFSPPLPQKVVNAAEIGHTGQGVKIYIKARGKQGNINCMAGETHPLPVLITYKEAEDHTLFVAFPADPDAIDYYDEEAVQAALRDYLPDVEVESVFFYDWNLDPYSKGTWAHYRPGWLSEYLDVFDQDMGRILFATGDHGEGWRGFIDGAIGGGIRAAERARHMLGEG
jgi:monoamine oxidase